MKSQEELEEQERRIETIVSDGDDGSQRWLMHLQVTLTFPLDVTGIENFRWEEPYVMGVWSAVEYRQLRKTQPSYKDVFALESIEKSASPEWAMSLDDLGANVRRKSDNARFLLGLSEIKAVAAGSAWQALDDYACWFVNYR